MCFHSFNLKTPPASPSNSHSHSPGLFGLNLRGTLSDDGSPRQRGKLDLSVFKNSVEDCLDDEPKPDEKHVKSKPRSSNAIQVDNFSGLRIRLEQFLHCSVAVFAKTPRDHDFP